MELRVLAQQGVPPEKLLEGWLWFGGLALGLLACFVVAVYILRRIRGRRGGGAGTAFDLDELREMRDTGELTIAEYETLRKRSIAEMGLAGARTADETGSVGEAGSDSESKDD